MGSHCSKKIRSGIGQLTLVEHSLCPLDARAGIVPNLVHRAEFRYSDKKRRRHTGKAQVLCPLGLSPKDEMVLWGLLGLTSAVGSGDGELHATRHYCLRRLGLIDTTKRRGGRQYRDFSESIERLAAVRYQCDAFYDPIRAGHRRVSFGFFSYSLPLDKESSRAWRFVWDPVFLEFVHATGGSLRFDMDVYRRLDTASRRMFLFLCKLFFRKTVTPRFRIEDFAEQILGVAATVSLRDKKTRLERCLRQLKSLGVIQDGQITREGKGRFVMVLSRGPLFDRPLAKSTVESPHLESLIELGFDIRGANRILRRFKPTMVREWIDVTLAARERFGDGFFRRGPPAFLTDNLKHASAGRRTAPDWYRELSRKEERIRRDSGRKSGNAAGRSRRGTTAADGDTNLKVGMEDLTRSLFHQFSGSEQPTRVAESNAQRFDELLQQRASKTRT